MTSFSTTKFRSLGVAITKLCEKLQKRARFRNFQVYQKNFDACVQTAKMNRDSIERMRFNEPDGAIPKIPDCRDLGYILRDMAKTIQEYSFQLARLSGKKMLALNAISQIHYEKVEARKWLSLAVSN